MANYTADEQAYLQNAAKRLVQLRDFLNSTNIEEGADAVQWFECLAQVKAIQGNTSNTLSFIACLLAKEYLMTRFKISFDVATKPQGAPGLDIDLVDTASGKRIIGEIKTTVPYSGAKNDLGAKQKETFKRDFDKLNHTTADYKFFFVTDKASFEVVQRKYASQISGVEVVLLTGSSRAENP